MPVAFAVETTTNAKTGPCSATYAGQQSCPDQCPFLGNGCYAEYGPLRYQTYRLGRSRVRQAAKIAQAEARAIDQLTGDRPLRLHVVGDCRTTRAAQIVSAACRRYIARGGREVWGYTHAWRTVPRRAWGPVSVLASCETREQAAVAMDGGYAAALVVDRFEQEQAYEVGGIKVLPCPWQTRHVQCRDCRLCWDDARLLRDDIAIGFAAHGSGATLARRALTVIQHREYFQPGEIHAEP